MHSSIPHDYVLCKNCIFSNRGNFHNDSHTHNHERNEGNSMILIVVIHLIWQTNKSGELTKLLLLLECHKNLKRDKIISCWLSDCIIFNAFVVLFLIPREIHIPFFFVVDNLSKLSTMHRSSERKKPTSWTQPQQEPSLNKNKQTEKFSFASTKK